MVKSYFINEDKDVEEKYFFNKEMKIVKKDVELNNVLNKSLGQTKGVTFFKYDDSNRLISKKVLSDAGVELVEIYGYGLNGLIENITTKERKRTFEKQFIYEFYEN